MILSKPTIVAMLVLHAAALVLSAGCRRDVSTTDPPVTSNGTQTPVVLPVVDETPDQIREEMKQYPPFSEPFEEARLKLIVALDAIRRREGVEGFQQSPELPGGDQVAVIDPATGTVAWRALACFNPSCPGRGKGGGPYLFAREMGNSRVQDGKLILEKLNKEEMELLSQCPACQSIEFVRPYDPAESEVRRRQILAQIDAVRKSRDEAESQGRPLPEGPTPAELSQELNNLPKLFLVPERDKVARFEAITSPKSRGLSSP